MNKNAKKGFTLIEILIAASLFVVVTTITTMVLFNIITTEKKSTILSAVYDDSRIVMEQLATMIHNNAIDYDEYYSVNVAQPRVNLPIAYGMYNGVYSSRFYDPGLTFPSGASGTNPENLGIECADNPLPESITDCRLPYKNSKDKNTGMNPYEGRAVPIDPALERSANAFCDSNILNEGGKECNFATSEGEVTASDELYLINATGNKKTIIAKQKISDQPSNSAIGMLELDGIDSDQNGLMDLFTCSEGYTCDTEKNNISPYLIGKLENKFPSIKNNADNITNLGITMATRANKNLPLSDQSNFIPITPFRSNVVSLKFIISPVDDPYKAYAEKAMQSHPSVTILLTMEPSASEKAKYPGGNPPPVLIQRTVTAGVHGKVESYPPTNDLEWVKFLIPAKQ